MTKEQTAPEFDVADPAAPVAEVAPAEKEDAQEIKAKSIVQIKKGAAECNGVKIPSCAYLRNSTVKAVKGSKAEITFGGLPVGHFQLKDLTLIK